MTVDSPSRNYADVSSHWPLLQPGAHQYGLISRSDMARRAPDAGSGALEHPPTGLAAVFCLIAGFSLLRSASSEKLIEQARKSERLAEAYENASSAVADEDFWVTEALLEFIPEARRLSLGNVEGGHRRAARDLKLALGDVSRFGRAADRSLAARVNAYHRRYMRTVESLFAAIDAREPARAFAIEAARIDPLFPSIDTKVQKAARANRTEADFAFAAIENSNETTLATMAVGVPIGFVLLLLLARLLHSSRIREERARADITRLELDRLHQLALSDSLTGLKNHRAFHQDLIRDLQAETAPTPRSRLPSWISMASRPQTTRSAMTLETPSSGTLRTASGRRSEQATMRTGSGGMNSPSSSRKATAWGPIA
jgi:hypothetical protein